ncbi:uncharacterized protein FIBRA_02290 [Fibroporia radiculosa]|uniref:Rho-GAP domain-containing protein n=1 Tax=Fibroporia radiculosa TaxID=599839 RepID=J4GMS3_9APHY|nr:uncharacterized protein FIBRA_02290 [Fibroporia radiculosa]CCM00260.1 predicted protein [Fibroporia radiculosa]
MAVLSLPLTFQNSFWSQDYRRGLEVLYKQLESGVLEDDEIVAFIRARAIAESALAESLSASAPAGKAFSHDEGASLHVAFRGLKEESTEQGKVHEAVAQELRDSVATPFEKWAVGYKASISYPNACVGCSTFMQERLKGSKHNVLDGWMAAYESAQVGVAKLKNDYLSKIRRADEAEDDARFAPIPPSVGDRFTTSPNMQPRDKRTPVRSGTVSERISQRFKEFRLGTGTAQSVDQTPEVHFDADIEEKEVPKFDKGKGRATEDVMTPPQVASPPPLSPPLPPAQLDTNLVPPSMAPPIILAGVAFTPMQLSNLLKRAKGELPLRSVRFPLLGEYQECFSGEEFATWLKEKVKEYEENLDRAAFAARELTEKHDLLRRIGQLGNDYENAADAYYQFRPKAFTLDAVSTKPDPVASPIQKNLSPLAENVAKTTNTFASLVTKALNANGQAEPAHIRARRDAEVADREYRVAVRKLDRQRLALEERVEETLKMLQRWELDRLRAVKTVLRQYHVVVSKLSKAYDPSVQRSETLIDSYHPEADLKIFIERHRTGPFRPEPQVYESVTHDESDVVFGIDLRRWADSGMWHHSDTEEKKDDIPPVLTMLLVAVDEAYAKLPTDADRRKTWIYDVPLASVHHLRESLNAIPPEQSLPNDIFAKYDAPVLAGAVKLWALELDPPIGMYEGWDEMRRLYPTVGSSAKGEEARSEELHIQDVQAALQKLPRVHLLVLDAIVKHLKRMIASTAGAESEETSEVYITKLALSMGRIILRPKQENEFSIQDRHPTLLFIDLLNNYESILPPTLEKKKRESQRKAPVRRRTRPVDMRMSRSRISAGADLRELQSQQFEQRTGVKLPRHSPPLPNAPVAHLNDIPGSPNAEPILSDSAPASTVIAEPEELPSIPPPLPPAPGDIVVHDNRTIVLESTPVQAGLTDFAAIPPPPPLEASTVPSHPVFKEPPPETDDLPPRPVFREPPPAIASPSPTIPVPTFNAPPPEPTSPELPMPSFKEPPLEPGSPPSTIVPPILRPESVNARSASPRVSSYESVGSRSPSPIKPITGAVPSVTSPANDPRLRGPRLARTPRVSGSGSVSNMVNKFDKPGGSRPGSPGVGANGGLSRVGSRTYGGGHSKRSSISRVSEFSRRTVASDAEDEVFER